MKVKRGTVNWKWEDENGAVHVNKISFMMMRSEIDKKAEAARHREHMELEERREWECMVLEDRREARHEKFMQMMMMMTSINLNNSSSRGKIFNNHQDSDDETESNFKDCS